MIKHKGVQDHRGARSWFPMFHLSGLITWRLRSKKHLIGSRKEIENLMWAREFRLWRSCFNRKFSSVSFPSSSWCNNAWLPALPAWASIHLQLLQGTSDTEMAMLTAERSWIIIISMAWIRRSKVCSPATSKESETTRSQTNNNPIKLNLSKT